MGKGGLEFRRHITIFQEVEAGPRGVEKSPISCRGFGVKNGSPGKCTGTLRSIENERLSLGKKRKNQEVLRRCNAFCCEGGGEGSKEGGRKKR